MTEYDPLGNPTRGKDCSTSSFVNGASTSVGGHGRSQCRLDKAEVDIKNSTEPDKLELVGMLSPSGVMHKYGSRVYVKK